MMTMNFKKPAFLSGIQYLNYQQNFGDSLGGLRMINRRLQFGKTLYSKDLYAHYGCVNAIEFSHDGEWLVSGGDDKRILIWNLDKTLSGNCKPKPMKGEHNSNIFCLGFDTLHTKIYSAGNDEQVILHDVNTTEILDVFLHNEAVYGLSVHPENDGLFASACDDGRVLIWDIRHSSSPFVLAGSSTAFHAVMYNPVEPHFIATANAKNGVCLWDIRKPRVSYMKYGASVLTQSAMSVRFNSTGTHLLALRRRLPPVLYEVTSNHPVAEFDHQEYYNSCTMKSCCFAGERDQYVLSGSDDFKLYIWKIPDAINSKKGMWVSKAHLVLRGHRSIVNQVRYNDTYGILASSGVEKIVKLWSSFSLTHSEDTSNYISNKDLLRKVYSHEEYINLVLESGQFMTHDYSHHSVQEDPRMMAFFDSLVQRDIEGWTSDSSDADLLNTYLDVSSSLSSSSSSDDDDSQTQDMNNIDDKTGTNIASQEDVVLQPNSVTLRYVSQKSLTNGHCDNKLHKETKKHEDPSLNRISQLIAQKRKEQMLKTVRAKFGEKKGKIVKRLKLLKNVANTDIPKTDNENQGSSENCSRLNGSSNNHLENSSNELSKLTKGKDKRKLLLKRRAKFGKDSALVKNSSDSEDNKDLTDVDNSAGTDCKTEEKNVECSNKKEETDIVTKSCIYKESSNSETVLPNASGNNLKASGSNIVESSSTLVYFSSKSIKKHSKRNYRKKSADDLEDD